MSEKVEKIIIDGEGSATQGQNPTPRKATGSKANSAKGTSKDSGYKIPKSTTESSDVSQTSPLSKFGYVKEQQSARKISARQAPRIESQQTESTSQQKGQTYQRSEHQPRGGYADRGNRGSRGNRGGRPYRGRNQQRDSQSSQSQRSEQSTSTHHSDH